MAGPLLNERWERFCQEMAKGTAQHKAYLAAGYKGGPPKASRLAEYPEVKARIAELLNGAAGLVQIDVARVLAELGKIGFSDIRKAVKWGAAVEEAPDVEEELEPQGHGGALKRSRKGSAVAFISSDDIDDQTAAAISEVSQTATGLRIKLHDKRAALVDIGKHLGMFKEGQPDPPQINVNIGDSELARLIVFQLTKTTKGAG